MPIRKIVTVNDKDNLLRTPSADYDPAEIGTEDFERLVDDMVETMHAAAGVGLAAPQIGVNRRLFVADTADGPIAVVNPRIIKSSRKTVKFEEGCLSIPGKYGDVRRHHEVTVEGLNLTGEKVRFSAKGFFARVMQHEIDHLDGVLYVDRMEKV